MKSIVLNQPGEFIVVEKEYPGDPGPELLTDVVAEEEGPRRDVQCARLQANRVDRKQRVAREGGRRKVLRLAW